MRKSDSSQKRHNRIYCANDCWGENMTYCFSLFPRFIIYNCLAGFRVENAFNSEILMTDLSSLKKQLHFYAQYVLAINNFVIRLDFMQLPP